MIRTQHNRSQPKLTYHTLAAYVDMWGFMTIKAVEEKAVRARDIGNCRHGMRRQQGRFAMGYNLRSYRDTPSSTSGDNRWLHVIRQAPHAFNSMQHRSAGPSFGDTKLVSAKNSHNTIGLPVVDISLKGRSELGIVDAPTCVP
jgi:hypothetical protein